MSELTHDDVQRILRIIDEMGDRDVHLEIGELKLHVTRGANSSEFTAAPKTPAASETGPSGGAARGDND